MSMLSGFKKVRRRIRLPDGYKLLSFWTSSQSVEMEDGTTLESSAEWMKSILDRCNKSKGTYSGNIDSLCNSSHNGSYWVTPQASGNKPAATYFGLLVDNMSASEGTGTVHTAIIYKGDGFSPDICVRIRSNNVWSSWRKSFDFLGNNTGYVCPPQGSGNLDDIKYECHKFVFNCSNSPSGQNYGFLDVTYFNGALFAPTGNGAVQVVRQRFTAWSSGKEFIRMWRGDSDTWSVWKSTDITASSTTAGLTKLYTSTGTSTDGTMTRNAISNELKKYTPRVWSKVQVTGTNPIDISNISANSSEILVEVYHPPTRITYTFSILTQQLNSTSKALNNGYYWSSTNYSLCQILISNSKYNLANCKANNNAEYRDACVSTLYYR